MEKSQVLDDLILACLVNKHGLDNWEMVADEFPKAIFSFGRCVLNISSAECQIKYENLKGLFKNLYQMDFNEEDDDENALVELMANKLQEAYIGALRGKLKLYDTSIEKLRHNLYKLEAEKRIADQKEGGDTSNDKMENINQDFIGVLNVLRSHEYCCLFETQFLSQGSHPDFGYVNLIKQHMDLQIIQNKLEQGVYSNMKFANFFRDLLLMFNNAIVYYPKQSLQHSTALELRAVVVREMNKKPLFHRTIVLALPALRNLMLVKQKLEKKKHNKAQGDGEIYARRSARLMSEALKSKIDASYDGEGKP